MGVRETGRRSWSVRERILAAILGVAAIGLAVAGGTAYFVERDQTLRAIDERLLDRVEAARSVVATLVAADEVDPAEPDSAEEPETVEGPTAPPTTDAPASTTREVLNAIFRAVIPGSDESAVGLVDGAAVLVPGVALDFRLDRDAGFLARAAAEAEAGAVRLGVAELGQRTVRYVVVPVEVVDDPETGAFVAAIDLDAELAVIEATFRVYTIAALVTLAAIGLVGWFVAGRLLRPLRSLRDAASRITETESAERIPVTGRDDVSDLTRTVNGMLDRLADSARGQRQLLDDVRHELTTPITIVRGHLELLDPDRPDEVEATRALAIDELDRMVDLVDGLAVLAEVQRDAIRPEPVDVDALTREVHAKVSAIPDHDWRLDGAAAETAGLDRARITQAWLQLADNAAKYSPAGSEVRLGSRRVGDELELWVQDEGPGIPAGAEERIFERFGRADAGRGVQGSGLGLPIVRTIAQAHGGRVTVASSRAGSRFALVLPAARPGETEEAGA